MSRRRMRELKDRHWGERCFIIGNGPSVAAMELKPLAGERTFSLNRGYLLFGRIGAPSTYHVVVNPLVVEQWAAEIQSLGVVTFVSWGSRRRLSPGGGIVYIGPPTARREPRFSRDPNRDLWSGATVTYVALQLAFYLGFSKAILIGVDHRFHTKGRPHQETVASGADIDHFAPDYFGPGVRWQLPDLKTSEVAYALARRAYVEAGRVVLDATVNGALNVFPKVDYATLF